MLSVLSGPWGRGGQLFTAGLRDDFVYEVLDSEWVRGVEAMNVLAEKRNSDATVIGWGKDSSWLEVMGESSAEVA